MFAPSRRWESIYLGTALSEVPRRFAGIAQSRFMQDYLSTVLRWCPPGERTCETGVGSGEGAIWLSLRGVQAEGFDLSPTLVERARTVNTMLGGNARFWVGDLFDFFREDGPRYAVVHHQGVLEHFSRPQIHAILTQQVASAQRVVFSVPSVYYPFEPEFGNERLLTLEEWARLLEPFDIEELRLYGDPQHGEREHVLAVLRGQKVTDALRSMMHMAAEPYPAGISAIVHTRNEARQLGECLETLKDWTDEIIVCDMESDDSTLDIARELADSVLSHPLISNFDRARNVSALRARYRWVFYLDADERVPAALGRALRDLTQKQENVASADQFDALLIPFRHHFAGHWLRSLYPGYTAPRLFRNGRFFFNARLHSGAQVEGKTSCFPADNPDLALVHYSYESLSHYLEKMNRYTNGEAANMVRDGQSFHWRNLMRDFVRDCQGYYDHLQAPQDEGHGFIYAFLGGFYRLVQHAKLYEARYQNGQLQPEEREVPARLEDVLEYALQVARHQPAPQPRPIKISEQAGDVSNLDDVAAPLVWSGPLLSPSGYGEQSRHHVFGLHDAGQSLAAHVLPWGHDKIELDDREQQTLSALEEQCVASGFILLIHDFPPAFFRHPQASVSIGRTVFETDRLPAEWVRACNQMDFLWVPSEFNRQTFEASGVASDKLRVFPESLNPRDFATPILSPLIEELKGDGRFVFLSVFDWTLHKGWDVLLRAFTKAFEGRDDVVLALKVWSSMGYDAQTVRDQAAQWARRELEVDLLADARICFLQQRLAREEVRALYWSCDAYVLPTRGEGWGRPFMEAMACGKPTIGTGWSGNTAFMTADNSYLIDFELRPVSEAGWRELPTYKGHRWAEPDAAHLSQLLQHVVSEQSEATARGARAREEVLEKFSQIEVARQMQAEIAKLQEVGHSHAHGLLPEVPLSDQPNAETTFEELATPGEQQPRPPASPEKILLPLVTAINEKASEEPVRVKWEGEFFARHSFGHVNRELSLALLETNQVELSLTPTTKPWFGAEEDPRFGRLEERFFTPLSGAAQVQVRHAFPPRLETPPDDGHLVLMQPWEYGYLPATWVEPIRRHVREVWCISHYVRDIFARSGIPEDRLQMLPLGVNSAVLHPNALPYQFTDEPGSAALRDQPDKAAREPFVFLFVGGTLERKGIDILLAAYLRAFSAHDEVCLVIKDTGTKTVYAGQNAREQILSLIGDSTRPRLVYIEDELSDHQLAGVFTACDCYVHPYRGEGFCLPVLEAMACGLPAIVPAGGPTDDFVDESVGWRVAAEQKPYSLGPHGRGRIGHFDCVGPTWVLEVVVDDLARQMRHVVAQRDEVQRKGKRAAQRVKDGWTWQHTAQTAIDRLNVLRELEPEPNKNRGRTRAMASTPEQKPVKSSLLWLPAEAQRTVAEATVSPRQQPTISLCMIARDEERVLGECLKSARPWFDEIIVVDTGSTDRTVEIAQEAGAQVFHFAWCDDFSAARNESLRHATGDWVFWMDADDTLPQECGRQLHDLAALAEERTTGFIAQVHIPAASGETGFTIVDHVKLFRNSPEHRFEGRIHEQILEPIHRAGGRIERSHVFVVHSGYDYSPAGQTKKRERDLRILEKDLAERPGHPFVLFNIGMTAYHTKDFSKAESALRECLERSGPQESTVRKVYAMLAGCRLEQGDVSGAREWVERGLTLHPHDPELLFRAGIIYRESGELEKARQSYLTLLSAREVGHIDSLDVTMTGFKAHHNLALIYQDEGNWQGAERHFRTAVNLEAQFVPSWLGLAETLRRQNRWNELQEVQKVLNQLSLESKGEPQPR